MMTLTTVSKKTSNNSALVFWRVGTKRKGILDVRIDFDNEEADLLAELVAIRYLALDKQVFAESRAGAGYKLVVSKGAIKSWRWANPPRSLHSSLRLASLDV